MYIVRDVGSRSGYMGFMVGAKVGSRGPQKGHGGRPRTKNPKARPDGYKRVTVGPKSDGEQMYQHRAVEGLKPDSGSQSGKEGVVDHVDRNRGHNTKKNLRKVTKKANRANSSQ